MYTTPCIVRTVVFYHFWKYQPSLKMEGKFLRQANPFLSLSHNHDPLQMI